MSHQLSFDGYYLRPIEEKDAWPLCDFIVANEERLKMYFPKTLEQNLNPTLSKLYIEKKVKEFEQEKEFLFTIRQQDKKDIAGLVIVKIMESDHQVGELAYCIGYAHEGLGIATDAVKSVIIWVFENSSLKSLRIIVHHKNRASIRVAEKNNFERKGILPKERLLPNGEWLDMELYTLNRPK